MSRYAARIAIAAGTLLVAAALAGTSQAQSIDDVTYEGTQEAGGPVRMIVSADGARIVSFEVEGVAGGGCSWDTITLNNWGGTIDVVDDRFAVSNADGDVLEGVRPATPETPARFEGTITVHDPVKGCETPPLRWVATALPRP